MRFSVVYIAPTGQHIGSALVQDTTFRKLPGWKALKRMVKNCHVGIRHTIEALQLTGRPEDLAVTGEMNRPAGGVLSVGFCDGPKMLASGLCLSGATPTWERYFLACFARRMANWTSQRTDEPAEDWFLSLSERPLVVIVLWPLMEFERPEAGGPIVIGSGVQAIPPDLPPTNPEDAERYELRRALLHAITSVTIPAVANAFFWPRLLPCDHRDETKARRDRSA